MSKKYEIRNAYTNYDSSRPMPAKIDHKFILVCNLALQMCTE